MIGMIQFSHISCEQLASAASCTGAFPGYKDEGPSNPC